MTSIDPTAKGVLAAFEFDSGMLLLTEAGSQHRASLTLGEGDAVLRSVNHTLKRALTDPRLISGIETPTPTKSCIAPACRQC